ncbi:MAG: YfcE family phosphodiesterase [Thermodesulfobacteriota bacterium]|nr:YfcE family phosphodiesterase [Thermodesulfobacteriota bacterium]
MKIGVMSDTHGNIEFLRMAAEQLMEKRAEIIVHLGDDYDDASTLTEFRIEVVKVPGVFGSSYQDPNIPNRVIREFNGTKVLITHTAESHKNDLPSDLKPEEVTEKRAINVLLFGHSHIPSLVEKEGILFVNPGHLKAKDKKGHQPSYSVIDFEEGKVTARIIDLLNNNETDALSIVL